jgi:hypothetical protein
METNTRTTEFESNLGAVRAMGARTRQRFHEPRPQNPPRSKSVLAPGRRVCFSRTTIAENFDHAIARASGVPGLKVVVREDGR